MSYSHSYPHSYSHPYPHSYEELRGLRGQANSLQQQLFELQKQMADLNLMEQSMLTSEPTRKTTTRAVATNRDKEEKKIEELKNNIRKARKKYKENETPENKNKFKDAKKKYREYADKLLKLREKEIEDDPDYTDRSLEDEEKYQTKKYWSNQDINDPLAHLPPHWRANYLKLTKSAQKPSPYSGSHLEEIKNRHDKARSQPGWTMDKQLQMEEKDFTEKYKPGGTEYAKRLRIEGYLGGGSKYKMRIKKRKSKKLKGGSNRKRFKKTKRKTKRKKR